MSAETINNVIKGSWHEVKGKIRATWGKLTNDEITQVKGETEELLGLLERKYGYSKQKAHEEIDKFIKAHGWHKE